MWGRTRRKVGRPTRDEAAAKLAAQRALDTAERKRRIAAMEDALREAELQVKIDEILSGRPKKLSEIEQMADTLVKLKAAGIIPKGKTVGEDDGGGSTRELIAAFAPMIPQILDSLGALKNTGQASLGAPAEAAPAPPGPAAGAAPERPPAFADMALAGAFAKRTPRDAAAWLWANQAKWDMVRGITVSIVQLPDDQLPGYLEYLAQYFPRTVAWLQAHPDWWAEAVGALRTRAAAAS